MKKNYLLLLALLPFFSSAQIITFPDSVFKAALVETYADGIYYTAKDADGNNIDVDANADGEIQISEAEAVYGLFLGHTNSSWPFITDSSGIEYFINLRNLSFFGHHLTTVDVTALTELESFSCRQNLLTDINIQGLAHLEILDCNENSLITIDLSGLPVLTRLNCGLNQLTALDLSGQENLQYIDVSHNELTELDVAAATGLLQLYCNNNSIETLNLSGLASLSEVICSYNSLSELTLTGAVGLIELTCSYNLLTDIDVTGLVSLQYLICINNQLTSFDLSEENNVVTLYCGDNNMTSLNLSGCQILGVLDCTNNQLTSLDLSINPLFYELFAGYNNLEYLNIKNGGTQGSMYMHLWPNPELAFICADEDEMESIQSLVDNIGLDCVVGTLCDIEPGEDFYQATGHVSYVVDGDCEAGELLTIQQILVAGDTDSTTITTNASGTYSIPLQPGTYTFTPVNPYPLYFSIEPASVTLTVEAEVEVPVQQFCIAAIAAVDDLEVVILPLVPARPGFDASYRLMYRNNGTTTLPGALTFTYMEAVTDFVSATVDPDGIAAGLLSWELGDLSPFQQGFIDVVLNVNSPVEDPAVNIDDDLGFLVNIGPFDDDAMVTNNSFNLKQTVVGSFDPNDKTCLEGSSIVPELAGEYAHYLIRFENTGNYPAENITVVDYIDTAKFDISTLVSLQASHAYQMRISDVNKVEFVFEGIMLPGEPSEDRHGFVAFKLKTLSTLQENDTFSNQAEIYFDFNEAVITNEAVTIFAYPETNSAAHFQFGHNLVLYPNPSNKVLHIEATNGTALRSVEVYNILGQLVVSVPNASQNASIDVSSLAVGTYTVKVITDKGAAFGKFIKE